MKIKLFEAREGETVATYTLDQMTVPRIGENIIYLDSIENEYLKGKVIDVTYRPDRIEIIITMIKDLN